MGCIESLSTTEDLSYYDKMSSSELEIEVNKLKRRIQKYNHQMRCYNHPEYYHIMVQVSGNRQNVIETINYIENLPQYS